MHKTRTAECKNELKPIENELKMNVCLLTISLNHFNEYKLMSGWALRKLFYSAA